MTYEVDDDVYPATTGVYIEATWYGYGTSTGSGVLVGRNDILTAAHVIYDQNRGGLADEVDLYPSYDPDAFNNTSVNWSLVEYYPDFDPDGDGMLFPGDFNSGTLGETELDIALFTLTEPAGDTYGWMGLDYNFAGGNVGVLGYPAIYGWQPSYDQGSVIPARFNDDAFLFNSDLEVNPGNSGGAVFYDYGGGPFVVGIVSTRAAAVDVGGHAWWLSDAIRENDDAFLSDRDDAALSPPPPAAEVFNPLEYIASYADLIAAFGANAAAGAAHYEAAGRAEGRSVSFEGLEYIASHGDLIAAFGVSEDAGAGHYINHGFREGRAVSFDALDYIASHEDLIAAFGADGTAGAAHYVTNGRFEGRSTTFDALDYIASHDDLVRALGTDDDAGAIHYIYNGRGEGRTTDSFDAQQYLRNYADLSATFGNDEDAAVLHYIRSGFYEGRTDEFMFG